MKVRALRYTLLLIAIFGISFLLRAALPTVSTGTWVAVGDMAAARSGACTAVLSDGRLLISGGADANGPTATADRLSTTGSWSAAGSMNSPRSYHSCALLPDGRVLVAGGTSSGGGITNSAELYDPSANSWTQAGNMNDARSGATASVLQDGRVLLAGGQSSGGALNTLEIFDPASGTFSNAGTMSSPRQDHAAAVLQDGRVLIAGGSSDGAHALSTTEIYDPQAGNTTAGPAMSTPRARHTATTLLDGTVVVIGGSDYSNDLASAEVFDPAANTFSAASNLATARSQHSAFLLPNNNEVLVVGGQAAGSDLASAELYIPWQKAFQATGAMATPRSDATGAALTAVDGRLLMAGGTALSSAELYAFPTVKTDAADYAPGTTVNITGSGWQPGETVTLTLVESPLIDTPPTMTAVADSNGNISNNQFSPDLYDVNVRFYLTAVGQTSAFQAQNTFTDSVTSVTITSPTSPVTITSLPSSVTVNFSYVTSSTGTTTGEADILTSPTQLSNTKSLTAGTHSDSITVTVPAGTANGTYNLKVTVTNGTGSGSNNAHDQVNGAVIINVPTDTTPPVITPNVVGTLGTNGWYTSNVAVSWTVTDPESSITSSSGCGTTNITADTAGTTLTCQATSAGGTASNSVTIKRDATPPTAALSVTAGTLGSNGWYTSDVTVHTSGTNSVSGPVNCTADQFQTTDTAGTVFNGSCTNDAGLLTNASPLTIKLDMTAPTATLSVTAGTAGANGWYTSDVTVHTSGTSGASGSTCTADQFQTSETTGTVFNGSCTNGAGGTVHAAPLTVKLDKTPPSATSSVTAGTLGTNGWYTSDVTVHTTGIDSISSPVNCGVDQVISTETAGTPASGTCTNDAGLSANSTPITIKLDKTPPSATLAVSAGTAGTNGWYTSDVTVHATGTDSISSPVTCTADQFQTSETTGAVFKGSCTNNAGLSTNAAPLTVKLDKTPPSATSSVTAGTAGTNGWYTSDVTVHTTGSDSISSPVNCGVDQVISTETTGTPASGTCTNDAGLSANSTPITIKLDKTPPSATLAVSAGTAGTNGWYTSDVTVHATGTDSISSPVTCTADQFQTSETTGAVFNGSCTNNAGLSTNAAPLTVKLDKTPPSATSSVIAGTLGTNGWYTSDVTVHTTGTDSISSPVNCGVDQVISTETAGTPASGTCTNDAGLSANSTPITIKLDKTPPSATLAVSAGTAGTNGWYTSDVTVHATGTDSISSPVTCTADQFQTSETTGAVFNGSCTNNAGLSTNAAPFTVKLDKTPPSATSSVIAGTLGTNGWYTSDVTVHTTGTDSISSPVDCGVDQVVSTETTGTPVSGTCTNNAGLSANSTPITIKLDKTPPTVALAVTVGTAGTYGWYTSDVTVHTSGTDAISGIQSCDPDQQQTTETPGAVFNGACKNGAGLTGNATALTVKLDKTPPTGVALSVTSGTAGNNGWYTSNVTVHTSGTDTISGPPNCTGDQYQTADTTGAMFNGSCTNLAGLTANATALTIKRDATPPLVSVTGVGANATYTLGAVPAANCNTTDATSGVATSATVAVSGGVAPGVGNFTATCTGATDNAGNPQVAPVSVTYSVHYSTGPCLGDVGHAIRQPINSDGSSVWKQGSTVPAKFAVCDANGLSIGTPGVVSNFFVYKTAGGTVTNVDETTITSTNSLYWNFDPTAQQWIFNIGTKTGAVSSPSTTYWLEIDLNDGSKIQFMFGLR